jgi:hypothetical protein
MPCSGRALDFFKYIKLIRIKIKFAGQLFVATYLNISKLMYICKLIYEMKYTDEKTLFICICCLNSINTLTFITETRCVLFAVRTDKGLRQNPIPFLCKVK